MADDAPRDIVLTLRIPTRIGDRIEALRPFIAKQPAFTMKSRLSRSDIVRYLLLEGIQIVEEAASETTPSD